MRLFRSTAAALLLALLLPCASSRAQVAEITDFSSQAAAYALIEAQTGALLARGNEDLQLPMASTTKIMTALVVIENCPLDEVVEVDDSAVGVEGSSIYLEQGESITVEDLLYGLMLASGNDAAVALACHAGGSVDGFADMMNLRAERMGLARTHFVTPNGLTAEGHCTTAYELCLIAREALENEVFRTIVSSQYHRTSSGAHTRTFKNKNALLWDYEGAIGVKTGYTMAAGRCLVFAAEREGMTVIGALLNCRPMFEEAAQLMDIAFETYTVRTVLEQGTHALEAGIENGAQNILSVEVKNSIIAVMRKGDSLSFETSIVLNRLTAPVAKGEEVGLVTVFADGEPIGSSPLVAAESVAARDLLFWFRILAAAFAA